MWPNIIDMFVFIEPGIDGKILLDLAKDEILDLMPGSSNFLARRQLWSIVTELQVCVF